MRKIIFCFLGLLFFIPQLSFAHPYKEQHEMLQKQYQSGNYKDAFEGIKPILLDSKSDYPEIGTDFNTAINCLHQLSRTSEFDSFIEDVVEKHQGHWRILWQAATSYYSVQHHGYITAGRFYRGYQRGGNARFTDASERDRIKSIKLYLQAINSDLSLANAAEKSALYFGLADAVLTGRPAWKLQVLSDLEKLPEFDESQSYYRSQRSFAAPVGKDGTPIYYKTPTSFETALNDGERWRWALALNNSLGDTYQAQAKLKFAQFLVSQFGVHTMAGSAILSYSDAEENEEGKSSSSIYQLDTLSDTETIARLANGIKRFALPAEFNFINIYHGLIDDSYAKSEALRGLATEYEDRRQYEKAAHYWQLRYQVTKDAADKEHIDQIMGAWLQFETGAAQPAGKDASVKLRFRNAQSVRFTAQRIKTDSLVRDIYAYLKSNPRNFDYQKINIDQIGYRIVTENETQYVGEKTADWSVKLEPDNRHFDKVKTIDMPIKKAGAYLITASAAGGNTAQAVIWLHDTIFLSKNLDQGQLYYLADATSGKPAAASKVEFFGYKVNYHNSTSLFGRTQDVVTSEFSAETDGNGMLIIDPKSIASDHQWFAVAETAEHGIAYLGFNGIWSRNYYDHDYNQQKVFFITDRPVYRPGQTVKYKVWVGSAKYDMQDISEFAKKSFQFLVTNPRNETIVNVSKDSDEYAGFDGEFTLAKDAALGIYSMNLPGMSGSSTFRVEEYKKPEFEVTIEAPNEPVMLGESVKASIKAKYYFGAPVTHARVKYKVTRSDYSSNWFPLGKWDWFYGSGYWWFAYDYIWYPGWQLWGCKRPIAWWWGSNNKMPEVVQEQEVEIGADGVVNVDIDTKIAKELFPDTDHRYQIEAEITDQSRRTITGSGQILVARKPFQVYAWVNKGYFQSGDVIEASFSALRLDQKPVSGNGILKLFKITYKDAAESQLAKPNEELVQSWDLASDAQGQARMQFKAASAGQYRLSYTVSDKSAHSIEGGYIFSVVGDSFNSANYRFNELELITDKREYKSGDKVRLMVNTNIANSSVLLFVRPTNGMYLPPTLLRLKGKTQTMEIAVTKKDMPNFYIEALTVYNGKIYSEIKEIIVPPEERALKVETLTSKETYKPGEEVRVALKVTDLEGNPFQGSLALSVYDKAVEYISGGSNIPEIKQFFWKWRRSHRITTESNIDTYFYNLTPGLAKAMRAIGAFGGITTEQGLYDKGAPQMRVAAKKESADFLLGAAMPAAASIDGAGGSLEEAKQKSASNSEATEENNAPAAPVQIRKDFADTAYWRAAFTTNDKGEAEVNFKMPENLSTWKVRTWVMGHGSKVGEDTKEVVSSKNLLIRMQAPRFFVEKDQVVLSANIHNYLKENAKVDAKIELDGSSLELVDSPLQSVMILAGNEARVDWKVRVINEGSARIRMYAVSSEESDALEMSFPVYVHGMLKTDSYSGSLKLSDLNGSITYNIPAERRPAQSKLEARFSPTLAGSLVDALPYLVNYPYGCTEQTLSRFLPTVITQRILQDLHLDLAKIREKRTNLNAQELGNPIERGQQWKRYQENPVFDEEQVAQMSKAGLARLSSMQLSDGGWGWFSGSGEHSSAHTTAYVVHGLHIALQNSLKVDSSVLRRGVSWLENYQAAELQKIKNAASRTEPYKLQADNLDALVYMVLTEADRNNDQMMELLFRDKNNLAVYSKAMFGLALLKQKQNEKLEQILRNISQFVVEDEENQTAYLKLGSEGYWWYWYGSEFEAQAYYVKLLSATDPKSELTPKLVKYLINNRKNATYWNSTRDTAVVIEALADFMRASKEDAPNLVVEILLDGKKIKEVSIDRENLFTFDNTITFTGDQIATGGHKLEFRKKGSGRLYYNVYVTNFSLEDYIKKAGLEIKVNRKYYKLTEKKDVQLTQGASGQAVNIAVAKYDRHEIADLSTLKSGNLVEIELEIDSKNDYEYLVFEDMKPAGFEPLEVRSGYNGNEINAYVEFRDERVSFFARTLARGKHSVSYRMRAEIPGKFSALPSKGYAMYAPELVANSDEIKLSVED